MIGSDLAYHRYPVDKKNRSEQRVSGSTVACLRSARSSTLSVPTPRFCLEAIMRQRHREPWGNHIPAEHRYDAADTFRQRDASLYREPYGKGQQYGEGRYGQGEYGSADYQSGAYRGGYGGEDGGAT